MTLSALLLISMSRAVLPGADRMAVGLTGTKKLIEASVVPGASGDVPTVLLIGGLNGDGIVTREVDNYIAHKQSSRRFRLLAIRLANPDKVHLLFPPTGRAYKENPESHYLWRWIGMEAPDLVVIAGEDNGGLAQALSQNKVARVGRIAANAGLLSSLAKNIETSEVYADIRRIITRS